MNESFIIYLLHTGQFSMNESFIYFIQVNFL